MPCNSYNFFRLILIKEVSNDLANAGLILLIIVITVTEEKSEFGAHVVAMFFLERELFLYTLQEFNKSFEKR